MSTTFGSRLPSQYDDNYCFFIHDFLPGDSLIVKDGHNNRVRAIVDSVDNKRMMIQYRTKEGKSDFATLNEIIFLSFQEKGWLE